MKNKMLIRKTKRLIVRPLEHSDYEAWKESGLTRLEAKNKWDLGTRSDDQVSLSQFKKIIKGQIKHRSNDTFYDLGIFTKEGFFIGTVSLMEVTRGISQTAYLGYGLHNRFWGKGYAKEAVSAIIDIGFKDLHLHRIEAGIEPHNRRSIALAKSLGMRREGLKKKAIFLRSQWIDLSMYTLTCEDLGHSYNLKNIIFKTRY